MFIFQLHVYFHSIFQSNSSSGVLNGHETDSACEEDIFDDDIKEILGDEPESIIPRQGCMTFQPQFYQPQFYQLQFFQPLASTTALKCSVLYIQSF